MNNSTTNRDADRECCSKPKCESGLRNNYFTGKQISVDSFRVEQKYLLERRRLLNRAIHGWGVVYGYAISAKSMKERGERRLIIGAGLALDKCGRELLQTETPIEVSDLIVFDAKGVPIKGKDDSARAREYIRRVIQTSPQTCWLLCAHYAEQKTEPVTVEDSCHCDYQEWDHTCETVRYSLRAIPCDECCDDFNCELECGCGTGHCCDTAIDTDSTKSKGLHQRGGCRCMCDHLTQFIPAAECCLTEIDEGCARVKVDLRNEVRLACVEIVPVDRGGLEFGKVVTACGPRRLVKRNDLLFDLIRGCDLTRISDFGWKDWHRRKEAIEFEEFSAAFGSRVRHKNEFITEAFWIEFSRPVRANTLRPDCFAMTVICHEREGRWWQTFRVPIVDIDTDVIPQKPDDPRGHVRGARIIVDSRWAKDGLRGTGSVFIKYETRVEIEVRGDYIVDCNGQTIDANAIGLSSAPTGNATPGGTFLSCFRVGPAPEDTSEDTYDNSIASKESHHEQ